jgi:hypothetical protein
VANQADPELAFELIQELATENSDSRTNHSTRDLQTIVWSTVVAGQPNQYVAVIRKTILRLGGRVLGELAALAAMILVSAFGTTALYDAE